jgi:hypothetical protein
MRRGLSSHLKNISIRHGGIAYFTKLKFGILDYPFIQHSHLQRLQKVGSKLSCGTTEAEALVTNVLAPSRVTDFSETL